MGGTKSVVSVLLRIVKWTILAIMLVIALAMTAFVTLKPWVQEREVIAPAEGGERVNQEGVVGNLYLAESEARGAVLVFGGSEGGVSVTVDNMARSLAAAGFDSLALSYWGALDQPGEMKELPLETFDAGMEYLRSASSAGQNIAVIGYSKGAEAALLLASRRQNISAVVAGVPTHVSWQAPEPIGSLIGGTSTFSDGGEPIPYLPYSNVNFFSGPGPFEIHQQSLLDEDDHPQAQIEIENARSPVLLLCGARDDIWPSCSMAQKLQKRAENAGKEAPTLFDFPEAGHLVLGPPPSDDLRPDLKTITDLQTLEADIAAREEAWPKVIEFLEASMDTGRAQKP